MRLRPENRGMFSQNWSQRFLVPQNNLNLLLWDQKQLKKIKRFQQKHEKSNLWLHFREFVRKLDFFGGENRQHVSKIMQKKPRKKNPNH